MKPNADNKTWISSILVRNNCLFLKQVYCCLTFVCVYWYIIHMRNEGMYPLFALMLPAWRGHTRGSRNFRQRGSNFPKIKRSKKKKRRRRGGQNTEEKSEGCGGSSPSADVNRLSRQLSTCKFFFSKAWSFVQLQAPLYTNTKMTWWFYIVNVSGVRGSSPRKFLS